MKIFSILVFGNSLEAAKFFPRLIDLYTSSLSRQTRDLNRNEMEKNIEKLPGRKSFVHRIYRLEPRALKYKKKKDLKLKPVYFQFQ